MAARLADGVSARGDTQRRRLRRILGGPLFGDRRSVRPRPRSRPSRTSAGTGEPNSPRAAARSAAARSCVPSTHGGGASTVRRPLRCMATRASRTASWIPDDLALAECQVGTWAGCVFINMDQKAPPLLDFLTPVPENLDPLRLHDMRVNWWKGVRLKANWKLALEAFMEGWHVRGTHTQLTGDLGDAFPNPHDFQQSYPNGHQSLAKDPDARPRGQHQEQHGPGGVLGGRDRHQLSCACFTSS